MKKLKGMLWKAEKKEIKTSINPGVYYMIAAWVVTVPMLASVDEVQACVNINQTATCSYPMNVNLNWHYSNTVTCAWSCGQSCNISISTLVNWLFNRNYTCDYHLSHASSWSWSWSWCWGWGGSWSWSWCWK